MDESGGSVLSKTKKDLSYVQGKSRICKIIREKIKATREYGGGFHPPHIQVVGLCGGGGTGKTTFCQAMCDEMRAEFNGKVFHFELDGDNELRTFQTFLTMLTGTISEDVRKLNRNECLRELGKQLSKQRIFLAIDNVTDSPQIIAQADALLSTNYYYSKGSVVLVTARSYDQIQKTKSDIRENDCFEMPELEDHEAASLLLHHSNHRVVDEDVLKQRLQRCSFRDDGQDDCRILPLASELLGHQLGVEVDEWMERSDTSIQPQQKNPNPVFSIMRKRFDALSNEDQILFMDVALFYPRNYSFNDRDGWNISTSDWLHMIHGGSVEDLERRVKGLKERSLLQSFDESSKRIGIHDLWREFAAMEANTAIRQKWFYDNCDEDDQMHQYSRLTHECSIDLQRAFISRRRSKGHTLDLSHCSNLTVLTLRNCVNKNLDLSPLLSLKYLELHSPLRNVRGLGFLQHLVVLRWFRMLATSANLEEIGLLTNLQILQLQFLPGYKNTGGGKLNFPGIDFSRLRLLRTFVMSATGDGSTQLPYDFRDPELLWNSVQHNVNTLEVGFRNFQELQSLQELDVSRCACIKALHGLGELVALVDLNVSECTSLEELPDLRKLQRLQRLDISYCFAIRAVPGLHELVTLQALDACNCCSLTELVTDDLQKLQKLQRLDISGCASIKTVPGLGELVALLELNASGCRSLAALPDLRKLKNLQRLDISGCCLITAVPGLSDLIGLLELRAQNCCNLAELPEICRLTNLQVLNLKISGYYEDSASVPLMKPVSGLDELVAMRKLTIGCGVLESAPSHDLGKLVKLTKLSVRGWSAKVAPRVASLPNLEFLMISCAEGIDGPVGISGLTSLKHLKFYRCDFWDVSCLGSARALQHLHVKYHEVPNLKKLLVSLLALPSMGFTVDVDVGDNRDWEPIWDEVDRLRARSLIASHQIY